MPGCMATASSPPSSPRLRRPYGRRSTWWMPSSPCTVGPKRGDLLPVGLLVGGSDPSRWIPSSPDRHSDADNLIVNAARPPRLGVTDPGRIDFGDRSGHAAHRVQASDAESARRSACRALCEPLGEASSSTASAYRRNRSAAKGYRMRERNEVVAPDPDLGVVAIVRADTGDEALAAAPRRSRGGLRAIEVTFTVPGAAEIIRRLAEEMGDGSVGCGHGAHGRPGTGGRGRRLNADRAGHRRGDRGGASPGPADLPRGIQPKRGRAPGAGGGSIKLFPAARLGPAYLKDLRGPSRRSRSCRWGSGCFERADYFRTAPSPSAFGGNWSTGPLCARAATTRSRGARGSPPPSR